MNASGLTILIMAAGLSLLIALASPPDLRAADAERPDAAAPTPSGVDRVLYALPFVLEEGFPNDWRKERPEVRAGYLLVLRVDPRLVYPRQAAEPVLYVGETTAHRLNVGYRSGHVVAVVPAGVDESGAVDLDLSKALMWFGAPELPERVDAQRVADEKQQASAAGIEPLSAAQVAEAHRRGDADRMRPVRLADRAALLRRAAPLVQRYAPDESERAEAWLMPVLRRGEK